MEGRCLCGAVRIRLSRRPEHANICNCRLCRASGAAWGYFRRNEVTVTGEVSGFTRTDLADPWLVVQFCARCGATTHYTHNEAHPSDEVGVNLRLFDLVELSGIGVTYQEGRCVEDEDDAFLTTGTGHFGDGKAF